MPPSSPPVLAYALHGNCYLNLTSRCNLRCGFCPRTHGEWTVQEQALLLRRREEPDAAALLAAVGDPAPYREVVFCGLGEPTLRLPVLLETGQALRARGARVRLNTNGLANVEYGRDVTPELARAVDAMSVSLNAQSESLYRRHCRPHAAAGLADVLAFVESAREHIADITLTAIDGLADVDVAACARIAAGLGVAFRARQLDRVG